MADPTMRAVRIHGWGDPPVVDQVPVPQPAEGESLVKVDAATVAHLDRTVASGEFGLKPSLPYIGGVEGCGTVIESDSIPRGTRVLLRGSGLGLKRDGTWAEYVAVPSEELQAVPPGLAPEVGATFFVPLTTAAVALRHVGRLGHWSGLADSARDEVVVVGGAAGAVGSVVAQLALREGASVLGTVADESQVDLLPPGVEPILASDRERESELMRARPATLLVDTVGGEGLGARSRWVRAGGRVVSIGYVGGTRLTVDLPNWLLQDVGLLPVNMIRREAAARTLAEELVALLLTGEVQIHVERFPFGDAARALELLGAGKLRGRAVLVPEEKP